MTKNLKTKFKGRYLYAEVGPYAMRAYSPMIVGFTENGKEIISDAVWVEVRDTTDTTLADAKTVEVIKYPDGDKKERLRQVANKYELRALVGS